VESSELPADDGRRIPVCQWLPASDQAPRAVIQVFHGLGEYAARYSRFAATCNEHGIAVVAHDHRGHGSACDIRGHFADRRGWDRVVADAWLVNRSVANDMPGARIIVLGHSMGSYIAQSFVSRHPDTVDALLLSASTFANRLELRTGHFLAALLALFGKRRQSPLLNKLGFGEFNKPFEPARTRFDWLSRDPAEVDLYVADPLCGGSFSNRLWYDLTGGLLEITSADTVRSVPSDLPILIMGGQRDPVGGAKGLTRLADIYAQTGHQNLTLKIYADGRHEMLNETNRDAVTRDILDWIKRTAEY
jgi:alpha-beta hydrolase superfamily lysophospholipase